MELEYSVLKVPCEQLMKLFRNSKKSVDKEVETYEALMKQLIAFQKQQHQKLQKKLLMEKLKQNMDNSHISDTGIEGGADVGKERDISSKMTADAATSAPLVLDDDPETAQQRKQLQDKIAASIVRLKAYKKKLQAFYAGEAECTLGFLARVDHLQEYYSLKDKRTMTSSEASTVLPSALEGDAMITSSPNTEGGASDDANGAESAFTMTNLKSMRVTNDAELMVWNRTRLDRLLVDYLLREGLYNTAKSLGSMPHIRQLVDLDVFLSSSKVTENLAKGDCTEALKWCSENRRRLTKIDSKLEFKLRIQEFVELRRKGLLAESLAYIRKHVTTMAVFHLPDVQQAMALLAFDVDTTCEPYRSLYSKDRWQDLIAMFKTNNYLLHGLTHESALSILVKAGVSCMKTQYCGGDEQHNPNCPTCNEPFHTISKELPFSHHVHSILVCSITGEIMNEHNPPMVLPSGNVYSQKVLEVMARETGTVKDPRTGEEFMYPNPDIRKVFIM